MDFILFDVQEIREELLPLTCMRMVSDIRVGILSISEKWEKHLSSELSFMTEEYLQAKYPQKNSHDAIYINSAVLPNLALVQRLVDLEVNESIYKDDILIAQRNSTPPQSDSIYQELTTDLEIEMIVKPFDIFNKNGAQIKADFELITAGRESQAITDPHTIVYNPKNVFIEKGATLKACLLNAENGYIYIGKNATISEMSAIIGNHAICEGAVINASAKLKGDSTIGPYCKVGGEISNSVFFGYSNKGHDGFLGNSVIAEWCNLGADTNTSNLKNNYSNIKIWNYRQDAYVDTGKQFCGLIMGDHSKAGINTMFNTGTVMGIFANIAMGGFPEKHIPSFSWITKKGTDKYILEKAFATAKKVMVRRKKTLTQADKDISTYWFGKL